MPVSDLSVTYFCTLGLLISSVPGVGRGGVDGGRVCPFARDRGHILVLLIDLQEKMLTFY